MTSNGNTSFPRRSRLGTKRSAVPTVKEFSKTVLVLTPSDEHTYHLTRDQILGHTEVDFIIEDSEDMVRAKNVKAVEHLRRVCIVKMQSKTCKWDFKHVENLCRQGKIYLRILSYLTQQGEDGGMSSNTKL